jgi:hypothetical protein
MNAMGAISGLSFAVEREGHATDGLGIAAAVTAPIPIVGLFVSLAATAAAVGTGIAAEVREKELAEMTQTIRERIKEACVWSCIEHLASACEAYVAYTNTHRSCAQPMEQLWQYLMGKYRQRRLFHRGRCSVKYRASKNPAITSDSEFG